MHVNAWWHQLFIFTTHFIGQTYSNKRRSVAYLSKKGIIARRNHIVRINMAIHSNKWASRWQICCYSPCCPNKDWEHLEKIDNNYILLRRYWNLEGSRLSCGALGERKAQNFEGCEFTHLHASNEKSLLIFLNFRS